MRGAFVCERSRFIATSSGPVDVAMLTAHLGLNHNAIRQHLAKLVQAELAVEHRATPNGPGRPRMVYAAHPATHSRWGAIGPYERRSVLLTEIIRTGDSAVAVGRRSVPPRRPGEPLADDAVGLVVDAMASQGFDPTLHVQGDRVEVTLGACPFVSAALTDPDTVCALHLGIAQGVAGLTEGQVIVDELLPRDPRRAGCRLRLRVVADPTA